MWRTLDKKKASEIPILSRSQLERSERKIILIAHSPTLNLFLLVVGLLRVIRIIANDYYAGAAASKVSAGFS